MATIGNLKRMSAKELSEIILSEADTQDRSYAIVDVRDDGMPPLHISNSAQRNPTYTLLPALFPSLHYHPLPHTCLNALTRPIRPHRRQHQDVHSHPLHKPRGLPRHPPPQARREEDRRLPLRPLPAARALRCPPVSPRARGERRRAGQWAGRLRAGPGLRGVGGGLRG